MQNITVSLILCLSLFGSFLGAQEHQGHAEAPQGVHHDFSDAEHWTQIFDDPERDAWQKPEEVIRSMRLHKGMTVADLGAGTGYFLPHLTQAVGPQGKVIALDPEETLVAFMKKRANHEGWNNVEAKTIPLDHPGLDSSAVHRILVVDTWHHIENRTAYARLLLDCLKPDGALYVVDFTMDSPTGPRKRHRLLPETIIEELEAAGFQARILETTLPNQYIVEGLRPNL